MCVCVKEGRSCSNCLPGRLGKCRNGGSAAPPPVSDSGASCPEVSHPLPVPQLPVQPNPSLQRLASAAPVDVASSNAVHAPALPPAGPSPIDALPDLDSVLSLRVPTLQHVPKAVRDSWAHIVSEVLSAIVSNPSEVGPWCKLFMLSKCLLANPPRGGRSHWRDTLKLVRSRIQKWRDGEFMGLWAEVSANIRGLRSRSVRSKSKTTSAESLRRSNSTCARRAVEDGQYKKALQSLTSMGLALRFSMRCGQSTPSPILL